MVLVIVLAKGLKDRNGGNQDRDLPVASTESLMEETETAAEEAFLLSYFCHTSVSSATTSDCLLKSLKKKVNVRSQPSETADVLGQLEPGSQTTRFEDKDGWSRVDYNNGTQGYVKSEYLSTEQPAAALSLRNRHCNCCFFCYRSNSVLIKPVLSP